VIAFLVVLTAAAVPFWPLYHVPWLLFVIVGFVLWRRMGWYHHHHHQHVDDGGRPSSVMEH
jgi:hypothetical protein